MTRGLGNRLWHISQAYFNKPGLKINANPILCGPCFNAVE